MKLRAGDEVIAASLAQNDADLLVVTENGYGKRTRIDEYPIKGRGGLGVKTVQLTEARGKLAGALVVRDGFAVMLMSTGGTMIRMAVEEVKRLGRATQGVIVMRLRGDEQVSTLAPVADQAAVGVEDENGAAPVGNEPAEPGAGDPEAMQDDLAASNGASPTAE
jgi:DNA gyrase subunit A